MHRVLLALALLVRVTVRVGVRVWVRVIGSRGVIGFGFGCSQRTWAQLRQSVSLSSHTLVQMPQVAGHSLAM